DAHGRHELGALEPGERWDELDLSVPQDRGVHRDLVEDRPDGIRGNENPGLPTGYHRAAAAKEDLVDLVEFAGTVGAHHVHRPGRGADAEDARHAGVLRSRVELQLSQRLVVQAAEVAIVNPRLDGRLHDRNVQIVPGAVDHAVPAFALADEGRGNACIDGGRDGPRIPLARARAPSGARWDTSVQLATLIMAQHAPTPAWSATISPSRGRSPSPTIPRRKNELKRTDRPTLPYNCIGRLPREETQPATRRYI